VHPPRTAWGRVDVELAALYRFVEARVLDAIRDAEARGDEFARRLAMGSWRILDGIRHDLASDSVAREPAVGYLVRYADRFWDHPELPEFLYQR
jgi:hypothetical protein